MLLELQELFRSLESSKKIKGHFNHKKFMHAIKKSNVLFDNDDHHDSHEFINWLLDEIHETSLRTNRLTNSSQSAQEDNPMPSLVQELFGGKLLNTFTCVFCEATNKREEQFLNLSLDIEMNTSLSYCLKRFSFKELLNKKDKFYCEQCQTK